MKHNIKLTGREFNIYYYFLKLVKENQDHAIGYLIEKATLIEIENISRRLEVKNKIKLNFKLDVNIEL